jgi:hypothetical protein
MKNPLQSAMSVSDLGPAGASARIGYERVVIRRIRTVLTPREVFSKMRRLSMVEPVP